VLHGVQLWVALPAADRDVAPAFADHADLPVLTDGGLSATVLMGELGGATSPARCHTPLVGAEITLAAGATGSLPLTTGFEYAVLVLDGTATVGGVSLGPGPLLYLGVGRTDLRVTSPVGARLLLLGGEPFDERIVMWWNFVGARSRRDRRGPRGLGERGTLRRGARLRRSATAGPADADHPVVPRGRVR
jgi:redox-sensitive bicupin YhaK (pirin superfamily)